MKQPEGGVPPARALIKKPPLAVVVKQEGQAQAMVAGAGPSREAREGRIREAAHALYEARGGAHGHDLDDWLAAEAALGR